MSVALLCENLVAAGHHVEVFTTTANGDTELPVEPDKQTLIDGVQVTYFTRITKDHSHLSPALLKAVWEHAGEFDIIHIHAWWNLVSVLSCLLALTRKVPVVISPRGMLSGYSFSNNSVGAKNIFHKLLGKPLLKKCHVHVTSANEFDAVKNVITPLSITNIPNFVKLPTFADTHAEDERSSLLKLLFLSRIEKKKGLDLLIEALKSVKAPFHLTVAGDGKPEYIRSLKDLIEAYNLTPYVSWFGFAGDNKFDVLQQHDLLVLPSHNENFGNVVIESLSVGTPVLVSEHVGLAGYILQNNLGWVCKTTPQSICDAIDHIAGLALGEISKIRKTAPALVRTDFTGEKLVQRYTNLYHSIA